MSPLLRYGVIGVISLVALFTGLALQVFIPAWRWHHEPFHSTVEAIGGLAAIGITIVLFQKTESHAHRRLFPVAAGFLGMGLLEWFHAVATPGNGFVLLRGVASLLGGLGFALVWFWPDQKSGAHEKWMLWGIAAGAIMFGLWSLGFPEQLPTMIYQGDFTPTAIAPKSFACMLFLAGAIWFLRLYHGSRGSEDFLFACLALMFGLAELMFTYSTIWNGSWWFWHLLRLSAYLLVLGYIGHGYLQTVSDLRRALVQTKQAEGTVRQVLEEREHMAENLHDGAIQSLFALGLSLERCQRLIPKDPHETIGKIGEVIADLKLVIRDLRGYISGREFEVMNGQQMEELLESLIQTTNQSTPMQFRMRIDSGAAHSLTSGEATDLLFIAREAMSNSVRHGEARSGVVSLHMREGDLCFAVEDDGRGFATDECAHQGHGLRNMAARARRLGARFDVRSEPGKGTHISVVISKGEGHASG